MQSIYSNNVLRVYGNIVLSTVDGPGERAVVHLTGCSMRCPGCFNKHIQNPDPVYVREVASDHLADELLSMSQDVTISGGEPMEQPGGLLELLLQLRRKCPTRSVILYTGWTMSKIRRNLPTLWIHIKELGLVDVVVDGPFIARLAETVGMRGSSNQRIHLLTNKYTIEDLDKRDIQVTISPSGDITVLGFPDRDLLEIIHGN